MKTRSRSYDASNTSSGIGAHLLAACGPLQLIAASLLASHCDSRQAIQDVCNLLATSKRFLPALRGCRGLLHVKFGPPATAEAAAAGTGGTTALAHEETGCSAACQYCGLHVAQH
jgi:hypothetical protein